MTTLGWIGLGLGWIACAILSYRIVRRYYRVRSAAWTARWGDEIRCWKWTRRRAVTTAIESFALGPLNLAATWLVYGDVEDFD